MEKLKETAVLIPVDALSNSLANLVKTLDDYSFKTIIIVTGSKTSSSMATNDLPKRTILLKYSKKQRVDALKIGIAYIERYLPQITGIVTCTADEKISPKMISRLGVLASKRRLDTPILILGNRAGMTGRSTKEALLGFASRTFFRLAGGQKITDIHTDFLAFPRGLFGIFSGIPGNRYKLDLLFELSRRKIPIEEVSLFSLCA